MEFITTVVKRPYVFAFLASFLFLSHRLWGWKRTFTWLFLGYGIAWASEFSSIHNGFPYGLYHYLDSGLIGELRVFGVPFFDSLSYTFLIFAGFTTAYFALRKLPASFERTCFTVFLGAFFTMLMDMIVDPLAHLGEYWFLGEIYYYEYPGKYFDVPVTNFLGWFLVAFVVISLFIIAESCECLACLSRTAAKCSRFACLRTWSEDQENGAQSRLKQDSAITSWLYPTFFFSIALFNLGITAWIGAWTLLACSAALMMLCAALCFLPARFSSR